MHVFGPLFHILGLILVIGASLWGFVPFIKRNKLAKQNQEQQIDTEKKLLT